MNWESRAMKHYYRFPQPGNTFFEEEVTPSTQLLIDEALCQGIEVTIPEGTRLVVFNKNGKSSIIQAQTPENTSYIGYYASEDKGVARAMLQQANLQVPKGFTIRLGQTKKDWSKIFQALTKPLVVKPTHGTQGNKVFMNIIAETDFFSAVKECFRHPQGEGPGVVVEEQFFGSELRIIATRDEALAVIRRIPANIIGDGTHTIEELIAQKNDDPRRSEHETGILVKIKVDSIVLDHLATQHLTLTSVPQAHQQIFLRLNSNISTGGDSIDVTDTVHPSIKEIAVKAVRAIPGLAYAGVDFLTNSINSQQTDSSYKIIELNKSPGFSIHEYPFQGQRRPISKALIKLLFP